MERKLNNNNIKQSFNDRLKRLGLAEPKPPRIQIQADQNGHFWRFNESGTIKWRTDMYGNALNLGEKAQAAEMKRWQQLIENEKDPEIKELLKEEEAFTSGGGSANEWQDLNRRKEDARSRGKIIPPTP